MVAAAQQLLEGLTNLMGPLSQPHSALSVASSDSDPEEGPSTLPGGVGSAGASKHTQRQARRQAQAAAAAAATAVSVGGECIA